MVVASPKAVLLDVGGVFLLPSRAHIRSALSQIEHSVADDLAIDRAHYLAVRVFPMDMDDSAWMGPLWTEYLKVYAGALGTPDDLLEDAIGHLRNEFVTGALWSQVIEGSPEGVRQLVSTEIPVGVVSNSDGTVEAQLSELEILQVGPGPGAEVACVIDSGVVGVEKPNPKIFEFALEILDFDPAHVWYVGDTPAFDVVGARRAGLAPILMDPFGINGDFGVNTVRSLGELAEMIAGA